MNGGGRAPLHARVPFKGGKANSARGDGRLDSVAPSPARRQLHHDPADRCDLCGNYIGGGNGVRDQAMVEQRNERLMDMGAGPGT